MKTDFAQTQSSTWGRACLLWLLTNGIGAASLVLGLCIFSSPHRANEIGSAIALFAAVGSLVIIPLAVPAFRQWLAIGNRSYRLLAACGGVTAFFLLPFVALTFYIGFLHEVLRFGGWVYLPAALLAATLVYRRGLFRPASSVAASS